MTPAERETKKKARNFYAPKTDEFAWRMRELVDALTVEVKTNTCRNERSACRALLDRWDMHVAVEENRAALATPAGPELASLPSGWANEGMVCVVDHRGDLQGSMGRERWAAMLAADDPAGDHEAEPEQGVVDGWPALESGVEAVFQAQASDAVWMDVTERVYREIRAATGSMPTRILYRPAHWTPPPVPPMSKNPENVDTSAQYVDGVDTSVAREGEE